MAETMPERPQPPAAPQRATKASADAYKAAIRKYESDLGEWQESARFKGYGRQDFDARRPDTSEPMFGVPVAIDGVSARLNLTPAGLNEKALKVAVYADLQPSSSPKALAEARAAVEAKLGPKSYLYGLNQPGRAMMTAVVDLPVIAVKVPHPEWVSPR